jgi:hypothetical protein
VRLAVALIALRIGHFVQFSEAFVIVPRHLQTLHVHGPLRVVVETVAVAVALVETRAQQAVRGELFVHAESWKKTVFAKDDIVIAARLLFVAEQTLCAALSMMGVF